MRPVVLVPRRQGDRWREQSWGFVQTWWKNEFPSWPLVVGHHNFGSFNRSIAINRAAHAAGEWDVAVVADADVIVPYGQVADAVNLAVANGRMAMAFDRFVALTPGDTDRVLAGETPTLVDADYTLDDTVSSCFAITRGLWDVIGGFDERFRGWGMEDVAFWIMADLFGKGTERVRGDAWHLWHPPATSVMGEYHANVDLLQQYDQRRNDAIGLLALKRGDAE